MNGAEEIEDAVSEKIFLMEALLSLWVSNNNVITLECFVNKKTVIPRWVSNHRQGEQQFIPI